MARAKGEDRGLFQRPAGSGIWWIRYHDATGHERRERVGSKSDARARYIQRKDEGRRGLVTEPAGQRLLVHDLMERYLPEVLMRWRRKSEPQRYAVLWSETFGGIPADALRAAHIQAWAVGYLQDHAPASCHKALALLGRVYTLAVRDDLVARNPVRSAGRVPLPPCRTSWPPGTGAWWSWRCTPVCGRTSNSGSGASMCTWPEAWRWCPGPSPGGPGWWR
jgi:hypothetical protein